MEKISWNEFEPRGTWPYQEPIEAYLVRMRINSALRHIPDEVFSQWLYPHYNNVLSIENYGWLDFTRVSFTIENWTLTELQNVKLIAEFKNTTDEIYNPFQRVCASSEDEAFWATKGTWRVPPIVLNIKSVLPYAPEQAELNGPFQLVEGHSRFRNLLISSYQQLPLAATHQVFKMQYS